MQVTAYRLERCPKHESVVNIKSILERTANNQGFQVYAKVLYSDYPTHKLLEILAAITGPGNIIHLQINSLKIVICQETCQWP